MVTLTSGGSASLVTIKYPPTWDCPADFASTQGTGGTSAGATLPNTLDVKLRGSDCHGLASLRRPALKSESRARLVSVRNSLVSSNCQPRTETRCISEQGQLVDSSLCRSKGVSYGTGGTTSATPSFAGASSNNLAVASRSEEDSSGATQYSTTNNQVASVDEADYVKNDANTVFVLSADGLRVIDAWPADQTHEVAHLTLPGEPRRLFLEQNRLVVYTRLQNGEGRGAGRANPSDQGCTYGYDCRFTSEGGHTLAIVFDVTSPAFPKELARYEMSGAYVASRRVGSVVYTVLHDTGAPQIPGLDTTLHAGSYAEMQQVFEARLATNEALIDQTSDDYFLPWTESTAPDGTKSVNSSCDRALQDPGAQGSSFVSLNAFDLTQLMPPTRTVLGANPGYVYASASALYLAVDRTPEAETTSSYTGSHTRATDSAIHKFALDGTDTRYVGSAVLPGHVLNQFAMDEQQGVLRVASTRGWVPDPKVESFVSTYRDTADGFGELGRLGGIAPTEDIRSVRFDGDRGFVVTFKKTDPLFVFDLAEPAQPKMLGELKIPGFSTYMHRLDQNHLMAVGFEADDQGSYAFFNGIQIQIFDVSDLSNPTLTWKKVIGTRGSGSEGLTNHLAFNYFPPKKMLALPLTICEGGGNGTFGNQLTFAGLMAFDISLEKGITEHGRLPFIDPSVVGGESCGKWWTDSKSLVKRSIFMDDWVYGLSDAELRVASLSAMQTPVRTVPLTASTTQP